MKSCFFALLSMAATLSALAQVPDLPGTSHPITMALSDLTEAHTPLKLKEQGNAFGDYYSGLYFQSASLGLRGGDGSRIQRLLELLQVSWTKNEVATVHGQNYLVTYILEPSLDDLRLFAEGMPLKDPLLKLKLMKLDQIATIEPFPELNREKYLAAIRSFSVSGTPEATSAVRTQALSNIKQAAVTLMIYLGDYDDIFPYVQSSPALVSVIRPYARNDEIWKTLNPSKPNGKFRFNMSLAGVSAGDIENPAEVPMLYDPIPWPDGRMLVAFNDGHAKFVSAEEWAAMQPLLKLKLKRHGKPISGGRDIHVTPAPASRGG